MNKNKVGIIILNYNNSTDTKYCICSILKYSPKEKIKLLIVDNGSEEKIREELHIFLNQTYSSYKRIKDGNDNNNLKDITYLCLQENCGYARGNNAGIKFLCQFESITHIMILNNDIIFTEDVITPLLEVMPSLPDAGTISPLLYKPTKEIDYCCARKNYPINTLKYTFSYLFANKYKKLNNRLKIIQQDPSLIQHPYVEIELPSGSCMMFEKNTIHQIEGFDPNTFLYYEESILYKRLKAYGKRNYLIPSVSCIHIGGSTTTSQQTAYFLKKCNYNSLLYYIQTYEKDVFWPKLYIQITGKIRLMRLKLGLLYKRIQCNS